MCCECASVSFQFIFLSQMDVLDTVPITSFPITSSSHLLFQFFLNTILIFSTHPITRKYFVLLVFFVLLLLRMFSSRTYCYFLKLIKYIQYIIVGQTQHMEPMEAHLLCDCAGSLVFSPLKVNFITTRNKATETINEIH